MLGCFLYLILFLIVLALVFLLLQWGVSLMVQLPPPVWQLLGLFFGILALIQVLGCLGFMDVAWWPPPARRVP